MRILLSCPGKRCNPNFHEVDVFAQIAQTVQARDALVQGNVRCR